ncbi:DUF3185 family protein [Roseovarius sp.]|jgi:hypothetical protein
MPIDQVTEAMTGRFSGETMWFMIAGLVGIVAGARSCCEGAGRSMRTSLY